MNAFLGIGLIAVVFFALVSLEELSAAKARLAREGRRGSAWPRIVVFVSLLAVAGLVFGGLFVRYAIGAAMTAGAGGGGSGVVLIILGFLAAAIGAAWFSFRK